MSANLSPLNFDLIKDREIDALFCESESCEIHIKKELGVSIFIQVTFTLNSSKNQSYSHY